MGTLMSHMLTESDIKDLAYIAMHRHCPDSIPKRKSKSPFRIISSVDGKENWQVVEVDKCIDEDTENPISLVEVINKAFTTPEELIKVQTTIQAHSNSTKTTSKESRVSKDSKKPVAREHVKSAMKPTPLLDPANTRSRSGWQLSDASPIRNVPKGRSGSATPSPATSTISTSRPSRRAPPSKKNGANNNLSTLPETANHESTANRRGQIEETSLIDLSKISEEVVPNEYERGPVNILAQFKLAEGQDFIQLKYSINLQTKEETLISDAGIEILKHNDVPFDKNGNPDAKKFLHILPKLMNRYEGTIWLNGYKITTDKTQSRKLKLSKLDLFTNPMTLTLIPKGNKGVRTLRSSMKLEIREESEFGPDPEDAKWIRIESDNASNIKILSPEKTGKMFICLPDI